MDIHWLVLSYQRRLQFEARANAVAYVNALSETIGKTTAGGERRVSADAMMMMMGGL